MLPGIGRHAFTLEESVGCCHDWLGALFVLREFVKAVGQFEHEIAGRNVGVGLGAPLFVNSEPAVAQLAQQVEGFGADGEMGLGDGAREGECAYPFVAVHLVVAVAAVAEVGDVGGEFCLPHKGTQCLHTVTKIAGVDGAESFTAACGGVDAAVEKGGEVGEPTRQHVEISYA